MALSGLDIYKLLPKTNCKECGFATCLAFAMQLAKKAVSIDKCPYVSSEVKKILEEASLPPIKLIAVGTQEGKFEIGQETVMFRHEEKFHHPCGIGFVVDDDLSPMVMTKVFAAINDLRFERVGQQLSVNLIAIRQTKDVHNFVETVKLAISSTTLSIMLMSDNPEALDAALLVTASIRPAIYHATEKNIVEMAALSKKYKIPVVVTASGLNELSRLSEELNKLGATDLILDTGVKSVGEKTWDLTQIRRQALKRSNRLLGYPVLTLIEEKNPYDEAMAAATYISKYAGIVLLRSFDPAQTLALLTVRQNIYTDPQKPLQIEPKLYSVGGVTKASPVLVTTNFSLSYYTVLGEVEASKIPAYILSVDTEGMSVLTAWAAEKFNPDTIAVAMKKCAVEETVDKKRLVIPGYVAMMSGELQEKSGWDIVVGPKEASGIPSFLKNL